MSKIAIVTGGSSGIGESIALTLSRNGYKVYATARNPKSEGLSETFRYLEMDVQQEDSVSDAVQLVMNEEQRIDVLINCAGLGINGPIEETPIDMVKNVFETNFFGLVRVSQAVLPTMRKQKSGFIINISSIAGEFGLPLRGFYSASKASVEMITESLRMEVKQFGIRVCSVQPGDFATNISANRPTAEVNEDSAYFPMFSQIDEQVNEEVKHAKDPQMVGDGILKILEQKSPSVRYRIGPFMQKLSVKVKRIVNGKSFEKIIMNHYKI